MVNLRKRKMYETALQ
ncbi:hypothetical protein A2U01_0090217, partial [Trifolium medium]|nr:hypothetical protein [Trifolium medium]